MIFPRATLILLLALAALPFGGRRAEAAAGPWVGDTHAAVRLVTAEDSIGAAPSIEAGLQFRFAKGWHGYWRTPGDAGLPPVIDAAASDNVAATRFAWPAPTRLVISDLQNAVYEGMVLLPAEFDLKRPGEAARLRISLDYAACSNICVPYHADLDLDLPAGAGAMSDEAGLIAGARAKIPGSPAAAGLEVLHSAFAGTAAAPRLEVDLRSTGEPFVAPDLFIEGTRNGFPGKPEVTLGENGHLAHVVAPLGSGETPDAPLTLTMTDGPRAIEFTVGNRAAAPPAGQGLGLWAALASALIGGLILNGMPCVLPVLSLKLLGLTRHAGAARGAIRAGLTATALGIVASFALLAAVLVALKFSGATLGWGIQFQQPWFLAGMATLTVIFALSCFEWLPLGLPGAVMQWGSVRTRLPLVEAFLTGMFATLLATPCSAPFVGTAVGFALAAGPAEIIAVFLCLGVGMALPYGAAALFPGVVRYLPRPGAWMLVLRRVLGLVLLATTVWLVAVLQSTAGLGIAILIGITLALLIVFRALVTLGLPDRGRFLARPVTAALAIFAIAAGLLPALPDGRSAQGGGAGWEAFDAAALPGLVASGKTVLVDVTATWCLTCKVNDLAALENHDVASRLTAPGTIRMRADWSRPDPKIAAYLHSFARYGIPLDVVYGPGRPEGEALPEVLTPGTVLAALDRAAPRAHAALR